VAYVAKHTWLMPGPRAPRYRVSRGRRRGMGDYSSASVACSQYGCSAVDLGLLSTGFVVFVSTRCKNWVDCMAGQGIANAYSYQQYGTVPPPIPAPPPNAPQTQAQMTQPGAFTPEQSMLQPGQMTADWTAQINAAVAAGTYTPEGTPVASLADDWSWLLYPALFIGGALLLVSMGRK